jgi:hypothetical protein
VKPTLNSDGRCPLKRPVAVSPRLQALVLASSALASLGLLPWAAHAKPPANLAPTSARPALRTLPTLHEPTRSNPASATHAVSVAAPEVIAVPKAIAAPEAIATPKAITQAVRSATAPVPTLVADLRLSAQASLAQASAANDQTATAPTATAPTATAPMATASTATASTTPTVSAPLRVQDLARPTSAQILLQPSPAEVLAQAAEAAPASDESLRQRLLIKPLVELRAPGYAPGSTAGGPTAFGADWGDGFVGISLSTRRPRVNEADGAIFLGFGVGDAQEAVGLEISANIGSLRKFASNGDFGFKLHRALPGKAAIAIGWDSGITWGSEARNSRDTVYGVVSKVFDLRPNNPQNTLPLTVSLGLGNGRFRTFDAIVQDDDEVNVFGSIGLQVAPQVSLVSSWTGQDLNLGISAVPSRNTPLFVTAVLANVFANDGNATLFTLSVGYGFNFAR